MTSFYSNGLRTNLVLAQPTGKWPNGFGYDAARRLTSVLSPAGTFSYLFSGATLHASRNTLPNSPYTTERGWFLVLITRRQPGSAISKRPC